MVTRELLVDFLSKPKKQTYNSNNNLILETFYNNQTIKQS